MFKDIIARDYPRETVSRSKKMLLVLAITSIVMMFAAFLSAYIVSRGKADFWVNITIPTELWISTVLIILSSITVHLAVKSADANNKPRVVTLLLITFLLGLGFAVSQYTGFNTLSDRGLYVTGNFLENLKGVYNTDYVITNNNGQVIPFENGHYLDPDDPTKSKIIDNKIFGQKNSASTYMIFIVGLHVVHVGAGLLYLFFLLIYSRFKDIGSFNFLKVRQIATYWHFVDLLWIILLVFLYFIH